MSGSEVRHTLRDACPWDFMDIYEAPDQETASRVAMISLLNGAFSAETWNALPYKKFVELAETL